MGSRGLGGAGRGRGQGGDCALDRNPPTLSILCPPLGITRAKKTETDIHWNTYVVPSCASVLQTEAHFPHAGSLSSVPR